MTHWRYGLIEEYDSETNDFVVKLVKIFFINNKYSGYSDLSIKSQSGVKGIVEELKSAMGDIQSHGITPKNKIDGGKYP